VTKGTTKKIQMKLWCENGRSLKGDYLSSDGLSGSLMHRDVLLEGVALAPRPYDSLLRLWPLGNIQYLFLTRTENLKQSNCV